MAFSFNYLQRVDATIDLNKISSIEFLHFNVFFEEIQK